MNAPLPHGMLAGLHHDLACDLAACGHLEQERRQLIEALGVAVYTTNAEGRVTFFNRAAAELWGWSPPLHDQLWCGSWRLFRPDGGLLPHDECPMAICLKEGRPVRGVWAYAERPDGRRIPFAPFPTPLRDAKGSLVGAVNVLVDISELRAAEAAAAASEARFKAAQEASPEGFLVLDALRGPDGPLFDFTVSYANPAVARMLDLERDQLEGQRLAALRFGETAWAGGLIDAFGRVIELGESLDREWDYATPRGHIWLRSRTVRLGDGVAVALEDITDRRAAQERIRHLAQHDSLTGLANRHSFQAELAEAMAAIGAETPDVAVLLLDLDNFKHVNDALGHAIGDSLLRAVAGRLARCVREGDLIARLGGDEFAVLLVGKDLASATEGLARRITATLSRRFGLGRYRASIGVSIGIAVATAAERDAAPDALLRQADLALHQAKSEGRGCHRSFAPPMAEALQQRLALQVDLQEALATEALELHYQPIFDLRQDRVTGFEALLRWHHPTRGMVSPGEFIPIAEETGLIVPIGEWALRRACADAAHWPADVKVAVNLSPVQFIGTELVAMVAASLRDAGLAPARLELEITESVLLQHSDQVAEMLRDLRRMGVRLALDDFGTGYSSLSYLRGFAFDKIKIDQSFVRDAVARPDCLAIVRSVAGLAAELGMVATAEGVEGPEHLAMVRGAGCAEAQGYHLGRPTPLADLGPWLGG